MAGGPFTRAVVLMPPAEVQWQPALVVLVGGLVLGALVVWWVRRRGGRTAAAAASETPSLERRDLDGRVADLLRQLRELDDAAAKRTPEQLARERYALELEAARALQRSAALAPEPTVAAASPGAAPAAGGAGRGFLWGAASSATVALLLFLVWQQAERRPEGGSLTGSVPGGGQSGAPGAAASGDERTGELRAIVARNPDDHDARLDLARQLLVKRDLMGVWNETQQVLERKPGHPRALTYQALVRLAMGQGDVAIGMLQRAIAAQPDLLEAHQNLAFVYTSLGRTQEAEAAVAEAARRSPAEGQRLRQALAQFAEVRSEGSAAPPASEGPHEGVPPPSSVPPAPAAPKAPAAASAARGPLAGVFGWIEADASVAARIRPGTVIFLTARAAGVSQGPPVAAKRLLSGSFPLQFELGAEDSMMGQPLPQRMRIDVRADSDGDPMTRPASDPAGRADDVGLGRTGVRIALK